jgi:hypothetical protein
MSESPEIPTRTRWYQPGDEHIIQDLFRRAFPGVERSSEQWRWRFLEAPEPLELIMLERTDTGQIVAHLALESRAFWIDGRVRSVEVASDYMVHPDHRGLGFAASSFYSALSRRWDALELVLGFPNEYSLRSVRRVGYLEAELGAIQQCCGGGVPMPSSAIARRCPAWWPARWRQPVAPRSRRPALRVSAWTTSPSWIPTATSAASSTRSPTRSILGSGASAIGRLRTCDGGGFVSRSALGR